MNRRVRLVRYGPAWLAAVQPWFDHPEVRRWLGMRVWPARELHLFAGQTSEAFRDRLVIGAHSLVVLL